MIRLERVGYNGKPFKNFDGSLYVLKLVLEDDGITIVKVQSVELDTGKTRTLAGWTGKAKSREWDPLHAADPDLAMDEGL